MSMYKLELAKSVTKDFKKIAHKMHPSIIDAIENLTSNPFPGTKFKKLKGTLNFFRLRVGDYRIIYDVDGVSGNDEDYMAYWGGGVKYAINQNTALRFDLRHILDYRSDSDFNSQDDSDWRQQLSSMLGVTFKFGG